MAFVEVAVNSGLPHRQAFSYAVPEGMTLEAGDGVFVPFGRRLLQGIVMDDGRGAVVRRPEAGRRAASATGR